MSAEYREEFDIFQTISNIMNLKIKRLFLDKNGVESCEYDNGEILNIEKVDLYRYPKLKSLIWWREWINEKTTKNFQTKYRTKRTYIK